MAIPSTVTATATAPASLYVGDLHPDITEGRLFDAFTEFKSLASVRVCRDSSSGRSLGYGYVNFISPQDAAQALETKNHTPLNGRVVRIAWSDRDPDARRRGIGNVFVKNLSESVDNVGLHEMFLKFGNIISCKVATSEDGKSLGYGFVQFESEESANSAIEELNGFTVGDKKIFVGNFVKKTDRVSSTPDVKHTNLYLKNLDSDITEELLRKKFSEFGKIASLLVARDENGVSKGFGFVNFEKPEGAKLAMEKMNGLDLGEKALYVGRAQKKAEREQLLRRQFEEKRKEQSLKFKDLNVYVKNIDDDVTEEELREYFSQCGTITSAKIMRDGKGTSKGFGFVCYSNPVESNKAVISLHGLMFHGKPLYVAIAQRKEERQAHLQLQYARQALSTGHPTMTPSGYPQIYYTPPPGVVSQVPPPPGMMYQTLVARPGWRGTGYGTPTRPTFQPSQLPIMPNAQRQHMQGRGWSNGHVPSQNCNHFASHIQQPNPSIPFKDSINQRAVQAKNVPNGSSRGPGILPASSNCIGVGSERSDMLSSKLASGTGEEQKQILGELLYPLVQRHKPDLVGKITGMLLEMDNSELLLLLESPEALAAKVEEAVQVLKICQSKVSRQEAIHPNFLSAEVAVI